MGLKEAMLELADEMESDIQELLDEFGGNIDRVIRGYTRTIRAVCKTVVEITPISTQITHPVVSQTLISQSDPLLFHLQKIEEAKAEFRKNKEPLDRDKIQFLGMDESVETQSYLCEGGPLDGEQVVLPAGLPVGAHPHGLPAVYTLKEDGRLHYDAELSARVFTKTT